MRLTTLPPPPSDLPPHQRPLLAGRNHVVVTDWRTPSAWTCDLRDGSWRRCNPPEVVRPVARLPDGSVWATSEAGAYLFDAEAGGWTPAPPPPRVRQAIASVVGEEDGEVLLVGGIGADAGTSWRGDPRSGRWRQAAPLPRLRLSPGSVVALAKDARPRLVFAGANVAAHVDVCGSADVYDVAADAWTSFPCPSAKAMSRECGWLWRAWHRRLVTSVWGVVLDVLAWGDRLVFPLGRRENEPDRWGVAPVRSFAVYDPHAGRWEANVTPSRQSMTSLARFALGDLLVCAGAWGLDAWDGRGWTHRPWPGDELLSVHSATSLDDGRVLLLGRDAAAVATATSATAA